MLKLIRAPHKYVQGKGALNDFYNQTKDLGKRFLFICSNSGNKYCSGDIKNSFEDDNTYTRFEVFGGISSNGEIDKMREIVKDDNIDVVVALGGGSAIDTAKATAYFENKKIVIVPTVVATDAPCTGLSVIYNDDGTFDRYIFYPTNPDAVIVDTQVIANAPTKFLVAGMGDALGTYYEARACVRVGAPSLENGGISNSAMALCKLCYEILLENGAMAKEAAQQKLVTPAVESIVEAATYLSGVGADNGGLAAAHSIYNGFTSLEECEKTNHGELVAFGTVVQLILENAPKSEIEEVMNFMASVGLPLTLKEVGVQDLSRVIIACEKACAEGETIHNMVGDMTAEVLRDAVLAADILGKKYYSECK